MSTISLSTSIRAIGSLTLALLAPSLYTLYKVAVAGAWFSTASPVQTFHIYAYVYYYSIAVPVVALVIGLSVLRHKQKAMKTNMIFLFVSIAIIAVDTILITTTFPTYDIIAGEYPKIISLGLAGAILYFIFDKNLHQKSG